MTAVRVARFVTRCRSLGFGVLGFMFWVLCSGFVTAAMSLPSLMSFFPFVPGCIAPGGCIYPSPSSASLNPPRRSVVLLRLCARLYCVWHLPCSLPQRMSASHSCTVMHEAAMLIVFITARHCLLPAVLSKFNYPVYIPIVYLHPYKK